MEENFSREGKHYNGRTLSGLIMLIVTSILNLTFALLFILYATEANPLFGMDLEVTFIIIGSLKIMNSIMIIIWLVLFFMLDSKKIKTILFAIICIVSFIAIAWISIMLFIGGAMLMNLGSIN